MLLIRRRCEESVTIEVAGTPVMVKLLKIEGGYVTVGITAPREFPVYRSEIEPVRD